MDRTVTVILGGGQGKRLQPLTSKRAKPAVPLGGKYRLIDIPISNAIHSGLRKIFVLTQFNSASLNAHITKTYRFDGFTDGWVEILAAEQTERSGRWYQGTADAVRQQLHQIDKRWVRDVLILSGDHLYRMDYRALLQRHRDTDADFTVSCIPARREECGGFGILSADEAGMLQGFREKPGDDEDLSDLETPAPLRARWGMADAPFLASMGVYAFKVEALKEALADPEAMDFGHHVIPRALGRRRIAAHVFDGYWEDIGTIGAFYRANLALCQQSPPFRFLDDGRPVYTRARFLPPSRLHESHVNDAIIADGCDLCGAEVSRSVIGLRSVLRPGSRVTDSIVMGADYYETPDELARVEAAGGVPVGIGENTVLRNAIVDKNARIGAACVIEGHPDRPDEDHEHYMVRDGIVCVMKSATIPPGSVL